MRSNVGNEKSKKTLLVICYTVLGKEAGLRPSSSVNRGMRNKKNDPKAEISKEGVT
jgi:hypothetical protein